METCRKLCQAKTCCQRIHGIFTHVSAGGSTPPSNKNPRDFRRLAQRIRGTFEARAPSIVKTPRPVHTTGPLSSGSMEGHHTQEQQPHTKQTPSGPPPTDPTSPFHHISLELECPPTPHWPPPCLITHHATGICLTLND